MKWLLLLPLLLGCYSERKAKQQFAKAAVAYPKIPAEYCADQFPVKDSVITDTVRTTDTLFSDPFVITDTVIEKDTVKITVTKTLPARIITNTVTIRDTVIKEGGKTAAQLKLCEIDKSILTDLLAKKTSEAEKYKGKANKRGWTLWTLIALIIAVIALRIYIKSKVK